MAPFLPPPSHNTSRSVLISAYTPSAISILTSAAEKIPSDLQFGIGTFLIFNEPIKPRPESSFRLREPFIFIHALAPVADPGRLEESRKWTDGVLNGLKGVGVVKGNYLSIIGRDADVEECFGPESYERLRVLKGRVDPGNVFRHVPAVF
jgi:hypothetical protein